MQHHHQIVAFLLTLAAAGPAPAAPTSQAKPAAVTLVRNEAQQRVEVLVDGQPFTTYRWTADVKKPVLFPIHAEGGGLVTRGWPLEPRPDEATDHRHHVGYWFNYGDVNGVDFWGHSQSAKPDPTPETAKKSNKGTVVHKAIRFARTSGARGELGVSADWVAPDGSVLLREETTFTFLATHGQRVIDRSTTLTAASGPVDMPDNKEGTLGLRVGRALEHAGDKNPQGTGRYRSSEGIEGEAVWGTRGRWMMLTGALSPEAPVTIAILDHPKNPGHPTYWHARPWGLFAANPLGQKALSKGKETLGFKLAKGQSATFSYRLLILSRPATPAEMQSEWTAFAGNAASRGVTKKAPAK
jgi:hypothetical protein